MTEAVLIKAVQQKANSFSKLKQNKQNSADKRTFAEELNNITKNQANHNSSSAETSAQEKISNKDYLQRLKKITSKNKEEIPSELLAFLNSGNLTDQQTAALEKLMVNLNNKNLDISELKNIINADGKIFNSELKALNSENFKRTNSDEKLSQIFSKLNSDHTLLSRSEKEILAKELSQTANFLLSRTEAVDGEAENYLKGILESDNLSNKLDKLESLVDSALLSELNFEDNLSDSSLLKQMMGSNNFNLNGLESVDPGEEGEVLSELASQLNELNSDAESKNLINSELDTKNITSLFDAESANTAFTNESGADKDGNFFELADDSAYLNFDFDDKSRTVNQDVFSLTDNTSSDLKSEMNLKTQLVEQFKGEYSPETKEMQIQLKPESLGKVDITLAYDNEKITGKMLVESELVRAQLENSLSDLKSDLVKQGINIEQFKIETAKNSPQQLEKQDNFLFEDQSSAYSDGESGQNQEYEQRRFFQGQYYLKKNSSDLSVNSDHLIMKEQEIINRRAFANDSIDLLA